MSEPLAYFLTWHTYGTWLQGEDQGSVDREHAAYGEGFAPASPAGRAVARDRMVQSPVTLDETARTAVQDAVIEVCCHRDWRLLVLHVRSTHVHCVVHADIPVDKIMADFKAYATRRLRREGCFGKADKVWAVHGSTRYLWQEDQAHAAVAYTVDRQGTALAPLPYQHPDTGKPSPENNQSPKR